MPGDPIAGRRPWVGFWGKIPARGDFVRWGLPREFLVPWDEWIGGVVVGARELLGEGWEAAWDAAAPCRFLLAPGLCGPWQVAGVWVPSRDRIGRGYPLTLAAMQGLTRQAGRFMEHAEGVGLAAMADRLDPAALAARLARSWPDTANPAFPPRHGSLWRQAGLWVACAGLPDAGMFAALLLGQSAS